MSLPSGARAPAQKASKRGNMCVGNGNAGSGQGTRARDLESAEADSWEEDGVGTTAATALAVEARAGLPEVRLRRGVVDGEPP
jgi:hypothetical protein